MKITKKKDHYLFENKYGSYHLSIPKYNELGKEKAIEFVTEEIRKKGRKFTGETIDFTIARSLGFCEYGIKDFCRQLNLDVDGVYEIKYLKSILTKEVVSEYFSECFKLFGNDVFNKWGGIIPYLKDTKDLYNVLRLELIPEVELHKLSVKFAYDCLDNFEKLYPDDKRPRQAIEAKEAWIRGEISDKELDTARSTAVSTARSTANSAAWSAANSARSAARSATWFAANSAANSAAELAAESVAKDKRIKEVVKVLKGSGY